MRTLLCAVALLSGSAAIAQTTPPPADPPAPPEMPAPPTPPTGDTTMPAAPEAPAMPAPAAAAPAPTMAPMASNPPPVPQAEYPRCSRTVTDQCVQNSARESDTKGGKPAKRKRRG